MFCTWKSENRWAASSDSVQIGSLSENKDLHLLLALNKGVWFATSSVGHQRVKYNAKSYLKSLIWALTLLGYSSHKTQTQEVTLQSCSACRIGVLLRQREFPRLRLKQTFYYVECENETKQFWQYLCLRGNCQLQRKTKQEDTLVSAKWILLWFS